MKSPTIKTPLSVATATESSLAAIELTFASFGKGNILGLKYKSNPEKYTYPLSNKNIDDPFPI